MIAEKKNLVIRLTIGFTVMVLLLTTGSIPAVHSGQEVDSGSDGSDGALNLTTLGTILFDPMAFTPPLDPDGDGVYHFTTINIASGVTVRLGSPILGTTPVVWLASGDVQIDGDLDLAGKPGYAAGGLTIPAIGGAGGFNGGIGETHEHPATSGFGPGGGGAATLSDRSGGGGGHNGIGASGAIGDGWGKGGPAYGNAFLLPLLGGSGGGGGDRDLNESAGGGAGGGAILIVSSSRITLDGSISVSGGRGGRSTAGGGTSGGDGGGGSGGSIRLMAPVIGGSGSVSAQGGGAWDRGGSGANGRIRIEAFRHLFTGTSSPAARFVFPGIVFPPAKGPSIRVTHVADIPVPAKTRASFNPADLTISDGGTVTIKIEAKNIPLGTIVKLRMSSASSGTVTFDATPLTGTLVSSTATATASIPPGFSLFTVEATWTP